MTDRKCLTPGAIYSVWGDNAGHLIIEVKIPNGRDASKLYAGGNFAITPYDGNIGKEKLRAYNQMFAERKVIRAEFHDALEPVIAKLYRTIWSLYLAGRKIDGEIMPATYDEYLAS